MKSTVEFIFLCALILHYARDGLSANILTVLSVPTQSHYSWLGPLISELSLRGHKVTVLGPGFELESSTSVRIINDDVALPPGNKKISWIDQFTIPKIMSIYDDSVPICEAQLQSAGAKKLLESSFGPYDLIIMDVAGSQCLYGFIKHFGYPPVIGISAFGNPPWVSDVLGAGAEPWQVPHAATAIRSNQMNYFERTWNGILYTFTRYYRSYSVLPQMKDISESHFGPLVDLLTMERNFSLFFVNSDSIMDHPQSWPPTLIPLAGLHLTTATPAVGDKKVKQFLNDSSHGAVFVSLAALMGEDSAAQRKHNLLKAFSKMKERVLWQLKDNVKDKTSNIMIRAHLTVNQVLDHPNVKAFVASCGGLTAQEIVYHGVPVLCLPTTLNDKFNAERITGRGMGITLEGNDLTEELVYKSLRKIIDEPRFTKKAKEFSAIFKDRLNTPLETGVFWVEYVLRHKGAQYLKLPAAHMSWLQTSMFDAILGISIIFSIFAYYIAGFLGRRKRIPHNDITEGIRSKTE